MNIAIVGRGIIGHIAALALATHHTVHLIGENEPFYSKARVSAIGQFAIDYLKTLNINLRTQVINAMEVWYDDVPVTISKEKTSMAHICQIASNNDLLKALVKERSLCDNITLHAHNVIKLEHGALTFDNNATLSADVIIDATGSKSLLSSLLERQSGGPLTKNQTAIVGLVKTNGCEDVAYQFMGQNQIIGLLPVSKLYNEPNCFNLIYSLPNNEAINLQSFSLEAMQNHLNGLLKCKLLCTEILSVVHVPLIKRNHKSSQITHNVFRIGDAWQTVHPMTGHGINLAIADVKALASGLVSQSSNERIAQLMRQSRQYIQHTNNAVVTLSKLPNALQRSVGHIARIGMRNSFIRDKIIRFANFLH